MIQQQERELLSVMTHRSFTQCDCVMVNNKVLMKKCDADSSVMQYTACIMRY